MPAMVRKNKNNWLRAMGFSIRSKEIIYKVKHFFMSVRNRVAYLLFQGKTVKGLPFPFYARRIGGMGQKNM